VWLVRLQTMTKNRIHQLIDRNHVKMPGVKNLFSLTGRKFLQGLSLSPIDQELLEDHLEVLDTLHEHIKRTEAWIKQELEDNVLMSILSTLPGFGSTLSALAALEIDDINRFPTKAKFASYCGLIPSTFASGGKVYHGDLIPTGNRWLRYCFIEASWVAIRSSSVYSRCYFERIKRRKGPNVAIVALARRSSEIAYRCLKEKRIYEERFYIPYTR
jgi:transposase